MSTLGKCDSCETELRPGVYRDHQGFYVGVACTCGASDKRLSDHYEAYYTAQRHVEDGTFKRTD